MRAFTARRPTMKQSCGKMTDKIRQYLVGGGIHNGRGLTGDYLLNLSTAV